MSVRMTFAVYVERSKLPLVIDLALHRNAGDVVESGAQSGYVSGRLVAAEGESAAAERRVTIPFASITRIESVAM